MDNGTAKKINILNGIIDSLGAVAVAFSGGVDSTFLLKVAHERLGGKVTAVTIDSLLIPPDEIAGAREFTAAEKINHVILKVDIFANQGILSNPPDRCYLCKLDVFGRIKEFAASKNIPFVAEGTNHDDRDDFRPGMRAVGELSIRSPLMEAGLTKEEIRKASRNRGLATWDRPANPCLATRIPHGTIISKKILDAVYRAERYLHGLGIRDVRVRYHGTLARIETPRDSLKLLFDEGNSTEIAGFFKSLGFVHITVDIEGYRRGSMNDPQFKENIDGQG
jgi:pyridinium-3,5-biscarboxylic acid mononucleotide sulfurtransferase